MKYVGKVLLNKIQFFVSFKEEENHKIQNIQIQFYGLQKD